VERAASRRFSSVAVPGGRRSTLPAPVPATAAPVWGWVRVRALVLDTVSSAHSRRVYGRALDDFWDWSQRSEAGGVTRETVQRYRAHLEVRGLAPSSLNLHMLRKLAREAAANGILGHEAAAGTASLKGSRTKADAWATRLRRCSRHPRGIACALNATGLCSPC
jgi:hypothetical protein